MRARSAIGGGGLCSGDCSEALERAQPILPLRPGHPEGQSHDYFRHGTTSLFAALDVATGRVIGSVKPRHRSREFLAFLRQIEQEVPAGLEIYLVVDNYSTHKTATVARWLRSRPHWLLHFIPTHSSWLNQVERFFALITNQSIRRSSYSSVPQLKAAILDYIDHHNANPKPFRCTATADSILGKVAAICYELWWHYTSDLVLLAAPGSVVATLDGVFVRSTPTGAKKNVLAEPLESPSLNCAQLIQHAAGRLKIRPNPQSRREMGDCLLAATGDVREDDAQIVMGRQVTRIQL